MSYLCDGAVVHHHRSPQSDGHIMHDDAFCIECGDGAMWLLAQIVSESKQFPWSHSDSCFGQGADCRAFCEDVE